MHFDLLIQNGNPMGYAAGSHIGVTDGKIAAVGPDLNAAHAAAVVDAAGKLVIPSFVDSHMHLDKALIDLDRDADGTPAAVAIMLEHAQSLPKDGIREDVKRRARTVLDWEIANGAGAVKSHVYANGIWGFEALYALRELAVEYAGRIDILTVVPWYNDFDDALAAQFDEAARAGLIDFVGGYPYRVPEYKELADKAFEKALQYGLPLDFHVDECDEPDLRGFANVLEKTVETGMQGQVTCGHVTALCAAPDEEAKRLIARCAEAEVHIVTLPSCNMYLMGRTDSQPIRRGITRVDEFLKAGVNVAYASDNVRDPFRPFGNGDMLEEGLFAAQVLQYGQRGQLAAVMEMGTENPARNCCLAGYGLAVDCRADLVVLDAPTPAQALIGRAGRALVLKGGRTVAQNGKLV